MTNSTRLRSDEQFYAHAEHTLDKIADREARFAEDASELAFLGNARRIIGEVVQSVLDNTMPENQNERRKIFWPLTGVIMDRQDPDVDGDIMRLVNYYAIRGPTRADLRDALS